MSLGLGDVTHTRIKSGGQAPGITTAEVCERGPRTKSLFRPPVREPTDQEKRLMFARMLENLIKEAMAGHIFSFNGTIYRQARGGAIGNTLTGPLAALFMVWWSRQFKKIPNETSVVFNFYEKNGITI